MDKDTAWTDDRSHLLDVLIEMHKYNDISAKHHEISREKNTHLFILAYVFISSVIITNFGTFISAALSIFLIIFSSFGFALNLKHAELAMMHYWRNRRIRVELDRLFLDKISFDGLFNAAREEHRAQFKKNVGSRRAEQIINVEYHLQSARVHQFFRIFGLCASLYLAFDLLTCKIQDNCNMIDGSNRIFKLFEYVFTWVILAN